MSVCANVIMKPIVTNNTLRKSIKNKKKPTSQTPKAYSNNVSPQMIKDILRNECPVWPIIIEFSKQLSRVKMQMNKKRKKEAWPPYLTFRELEMRFHFNNLEFGPGPDFQTILQTLSNLTFKPAPLVPHLLCTIQIHVRLILCADHKAAIPSSYHSNHGLSSSTHSTPWGRISLGS